MSYSMIEMLKSKVKELQHENAKLRKDRQDILSQIVQESAKTVDRELLMQKQAKVIEAARAFSKRVFDYFHDEINDQSFIETADRELAEALTDLEEGER